MDELEELARKENTKVNILFSNPPNIVTIVTNVTPSYEMGVTMLVTFF